MKPYRDPSKDFFYPHTDRWWSFNGVVAIVIVSIKVGLLLVAIGAVIIKCFRIIF
jgi:hypothetical protein